MGMKLRQLGASDIYLSPIIMGTWQAGKTMWSGINDKESLRAIRAGFNSGIIAFDTAELYGNGHSERIIGEALRGFRDQAVIASKVSPRHMRYNQVIAACERSLRNLKTDYIDLYQIHWPSGSFGNKEVPVEETMEAMNELKARGSIREIGLSNFSRTQLQEALQYGSVQSIQPPYSLFWRHAEKDLIGYCVENSISVLAYSPMAQGLLTGKFKKGHIFQKGDHRIKNRLFSREISDNVQDALTRISAFARSKGVTMAQLALAWVIAQPGTCAIAGARDEEQVKQNAKAEEIFLSDDDLAELDMISRMVTDSLDDNPIMWE